MRSMHMPYKTQIRGSSRGAIILLPTLFSASPVLADAGAERESLARLMHEIQAECPATWKK